MVKKRPAATLTTSKLETVPLASVKRHPQNPRRGDLDAIKSSIRTFGIFWSPLVVQRSTGFVLAGNHRHEALEQLAAEGLAVDKVPVAFVDVDDATARRIMLADNRIADMGDYDPSAMLDVMAAIKADGASLDGTGYVHEDSGVIASVIKSQEDAAALIRKAKEWSVDPVEVHAEFFFRAPAELQAKVRAMLAREFPGVPFTESVLKAV